ncbi:urease accessory protein UreD [Mesorhizobium xinjiangense]|uniref:urease accessory protein UreD n=1 Tax=Mesorhizobium xinjiangense TaxID=2678685 RepID=UPI001F33A4AD|nr:urease accessory protein UreD [Mesorhizobium xinjiangense]
MSIEPAIDPGLKSQRVRARGALCVTRRAGRTRIQRMFQEGAAKIRLPQGEDPLQAVLINTAGGLTGGDSLEWAFEVGDDASAILTTQACERAYRSAAGTATVSTSIAVGAGGRVCWLPQETILFDGSALRRRLEVDLAPDAEGLFLEATIFGRTAMGEVVRRAEFRDRWRVRQSGRLVHAEDFAIGPMIADRLGRRAVTLGGAAVATVLLVAPEAPERLEAARAIMGEDGGASAWQVGDTGKLLARLCCKDGYHLRKRLVALLELLNERAGLPKVWSL